MATGNKKYVVMSDAVVVTTGKKNNGRAEYTRVMRGGIVNGNPESEQVKAFVASGALVQARNAEHAAELRHPSKRLTVKQAAARMGAADDPVQPPIKEAAPLPAPTPAVSPDAILPDSE